MKIGIQTWGSTGDIRPFLALADGLQKFGHEVTLVITTFGYKFNYDSSETEFKVQFCPHKEFDEAEGEQLLFTLSQESNVIKQVQTLTEKLFLPAETEAYAAAETLCAENDLVIGSFVHYPLQIAAEIAQCPYVSVVLVHSAIPTRSRPPQTMPNLGRLGNPLLWSLAKFVSNRTLKPYVKTLRTKKGLSPNSNGIGLVALSEQLTLIAISPEFCAQDPHWSESLKVSGFLNLPLSDQQKQLSPQLETFLANGEAPVYLTFGSWLLGKTEDQLQTAYTMREAVEIAGVRAIIQFPTWEEKGLVSTETIHYVSATPHQLVFPHCQAVVHHGGAGTTQSSLLAGKPSIVVIHGVDQEFWADELMRLGVGTKPLYLRDLTAEDLAQRIRQVVNSNQLTTQAQQVGLRMQQEDGVQTAVKLINDKFAARVGAFSS